MTARIESDPVSAVTNGGAPGALPVPSRALSASFAGIEAASDIRAPAASKPYAGGASAPRS